MELVRRLLHRDRMTGQAARFVIVGGLNTLVDLGGFYLLVHIPGMPHLAAKGVSYFLGICNSFLWNKYWTFNAARSERGGREYAIFVLVNLPPLAINVFVFGMLGLWIHSGSRLVQLAKAFAAALVTVAWNFLGSRYFAFKHSAVKGSTKEGAHE